MPVLVDTNILVRFLDGRSADHAVCVDALRFASTRGAEFVICAQVEIEFWSVATRPLAVNGLGMKPAEADGALQDFEQFLTVLPEPADMAARWRRLVVQHAISGRANHDARLAALMEAHGVKRLLTINTSDFARYPQIELLSPQQVTSGRF